MVTKKNITIAVIIAVILVSGLVIWLVTRDTSTSVSSATQQPNYATLSPAGKSADELSWQRISPPNGDPVYAFADSVDGVSVSVSQQPLPASFAADPDGQVAELAKSYNATNRITAGGVTAYIGTSAKGPQSVIFTKNNLLVLIKSQGKIDDNAWSTYIESLS